MTDFAPGFFDRADEREDALFYAPQRFVTHIDDDAIGDVGALYRELGVTGRVLDLMSSWVSHFVEPPAELVVLGMNAEELSANVAASERIVRDLNREPSIPLADASVDHAVCCVSVDYLTRPVDVFRDVGRVLVPGGQFVVTFSNRCFPTKAIRGWLSTDDEGHCRLVAEYFRRSGGFDDPTVRVVAPPGRGRDPLYAVWASRT
jgi:SAM-dependent methyltransferase